MEKLKQSSRCPVVYKDQPLIPMTWFRVRQLMKQGRGVLVKHKTLGWYFKLKDKPSDTKTIEFVLGIDEGTRFTGYSVVSHKVHNANFQRDTPKSSVDKIQKSTKERREFRRERRNRLRHREARFNSRTGSKLTKTHHYYLQTRKQMVKDIMSLYPITQVVEEDVSYPHWGDSEGLGRYFSNIEVVKNKFREFLGSLGLEIILSDCKDASNLRKSIFNHDLKSIDKGVRTFWSNCVDSFSLAKSQFLGTLRKFLSGVWFISEKVRSYHRKSGRRNLREFSGKASGCGDGWYYRYPNGIETRIHKFHKCLKVRTKINDSKSNHGPWDYTYSFNQNSCEYWKRGFVRLFGSFNSYGINKFKGSKFYDNYLEISYGI